jgi:hypothetical protein
MMHSCASQRTQDCQSSCPVVPLAHDAGGKTTPRGILPVVTSCQRAMSSLRASATIIVLRVLPRPSTVRIESLGQSAVLLEPEKTPSQLDHTAPDASVAGTRKTPLAPASAALVRRAGKASVAGDGLAIAQATREDLVDPHVGRLDANAEDSRNEANIAWGPFSPAGAAANLRNRSCSIARIRSRTTRNRAKWRRSSARVFSSNGVPSAVRRPSGFSAALCRVGRKLRMPKRARIALIWFTIRVWSVTRFPRSRLGRLASSSSAVGDRNHAAMALLTAQPA